MGGPRPPDDRLGFLGSLAFEVSSLLKITEPFEECAAHTHSIIPYVSLITLKRAAHTRSLSPQGL